MHLALFQGSRLTLREVTSTALFSHFVQKVEPGTTYAMLTSSQEPSNSRQGYKPLSNTIPPLRFARSRALLRSAY